MKRLIFTLSLAFLVGSFALIGLSTTAQGFSTTRDQAQVATPGSFRTVDWVRRDYVVERDFDRPVVREYYEEAPVVRERIIEEPQIVEEPPVYYYEPGITVGVPFFSFHVW